MTLINPVFAEWKFVGLELTNKMMYHCCWWILAPLKFDEYLIKTPGFYSFPFIQYYKIQNMIFIMVLIDKKTYFSF